MHCHLDYETRSVCDLKEAGVYVYARHPSTSVLCCAYSIDGGPIFMWPTAANPRMPDDLKAAMLNPACEMHAWNAQFERLITKHVLGIDIPLERWRCTAALARVRGLPGKLEKALEYLGLGQELDVKRYGSQIMLKWCKPLPMGGWADDPTEFESLKNYCCYDVHSEMGIARRLVPLRKQEAADYILTERVNDAGLPIDVALALAAQAYGAQEKAELNGLLRDLTGGTITSTSQHARIKGWLKERLGPDLFAQFFVKVIGVRHATRNSSGEDITTRKESTDKNARADFLQSEAAKEADPDVIELIELVDDAGKASVAKYARMAARAAFDGRAQGAYIYAGAIQTKRFSSTGVQMHNLPRATPEDVPAAVQAVLEQRLEGKVMHTLASLLRPTIMAPAGRKLVWGDWSSVEARGMPWLADAQDKLDLYRQGVDVYRKNAQDIFGTPYDEVPDDERQIGKVAELSLQFGGAYGALRAMARNYGVSLTEQRANGVINAWRKANQWALRFSYLLDFAFANTLIGNDSTCGHVTYRQIDPLLPDTISVECTLPGGTTLYYHGIRGHLTLKSRRNGNFQQRIDLAPGLKLPPISFIDTWIYTWETEILFQKSLPGGFRTERSWYGLLAENVTQALCAGLLRDCAARVEKRLHAAKLDALIVGHTHDELILEAADAHVEKTKQVLRREMVKVPQWLSGFPLDCEVKSGLRYSK